MPLRYATLTLAALLLGGCASTPFVLPPVPRPQLPGATPPAPADGGGRVYPGSSTWPDEQLPPATPVPVPAGPGATVPSPVPDLPPAAQSGVPRARFGLRTVDCPLPDGSRGVYVYKLLPGSPLAGSLDVGDRVTRLQGVDVTSSASLTNLIATIRPLTPTQLSFVRGGAATSVSFLPPPWVPTEADLAPINQPISTALAANLCRIVTRVAAGGAQ